jgi:hypothetical protein
VDSVGIRAILSRRARPLDGAALVFRNTAGTRDLRWAKKTVPAALRAARIEDFRFHDLRHTFASRLAMESVDLMTIRDLMGHKPITMTLRYSHLSPGHRQKAVERLVTRPVVKPEAAAGSGTSSTVSSTERTGQKRTGVQVYERLGEPCGIRTHDPLIKSSSQDQPTDTVEDPSQQESRDST